MHTKILVAYFIISDKKKLKYKWRITAARPTHYFVGIRAVEGVRRLSYPGPRRGPAIPQNDFSVAVYGKYKS